MMNLISRTEGHLMKTGVIVLIILFVVLLISVFRGNSVNFNDREVSFITGNERGVYYSAGQALCGILEREASANNCSVVQSSGSEENVTKIRNQDAYAGIVRADVFYRNKDNLQQVGSLHNENLMILVRNDENIKSLTDLAGKKIVIGEAGSNTYKISNTILGEVGIEEHVLIEEVDPEQSVGNRFGKLCGGEASAVFYFVGYPSQDVQEALGDCPNTISILSLTESTINKITTKRPYYKKSVIPSSVYDGVEKDIKTVGLTAIVAVSNDIEERELNYLKKVFAENIGDIQNARTALEYVTEESFNEMLIPEDEGQEQDQEEETQTDIETEQ